MLAVDATRCRRRSYILRIGRRLVGGVLVEIDGVDGTLGAIHVPHSERRPTMSPTLSPRPVVYYSFAANVSIPSRYVLEIQASIRTLRRHNKNIAVVFFVFGSGMPIQLANELRALGVAIRYMEDYHSMLSATVSRDKADVLQHYPTLHKWRCIPVLLEEFAPTQILYIDCDTLFNGDVGALFERYDGADLYAREEPSSRGSPLGYDSEYLDESRLEALYLAEGSRYIQPFNVGCMLLTNKLAERLWNSFDVLINYVWRFIVDLAERPAADSDGLDVVSFRRSKGMLTSSDRPLPYPSRNPWIKDEAALWMTLGGIEDVRVGIFKTEDVIQGLEILFRDVPWIVSHYFSVNWDRLPREEFGIDPERSTTTNPSIARITENPTINPLAVCSRLQYEGKTVGIYVWTPSSAGAPRAGLIAKARHPELFEMLLTALEGERDVEADLTIDQIDALVKVGFLI